MKLVASGLLALIALFFAVVGVGTLMMLPAQVAKNHIYYQQFEKAAAYVDAHGRLPDAKVLDLWANESSGPSIWHSLKDQPFECDAGFAKAASDRFVLSFWRGEWSECFAYPSGRTTMPLSVRGYLDIGYLTYWAIALASSWGAWRLTRSWLAERRRTGSGA